MMTIEQHSDYVNELFTMLCKTVRLYGADSPQAEAMASIHSAGVMAYLERVNNESN